MKWSGEEVNGIAVDGATLPVLQADAVARRVSSLLGLHPGTVQIVGVHVPDFGFGRCVVLGVRKQGPGEGAAAIEAAWALLDETDGGGAADFVIAVDHTVDVADHERVFFHLCANCDPGRDLLRSGARIGFDATAKLPGDDRNGHAVRAFPPILVMDGDVSRRVTARAAEFGLG